MAMKLTFLGTSDAIPTATRNHSAALLTYDGENILVDCGEGTQRQFKKAKISPTKITRLLITHWHGDHILGIPGLIQSLGLMGYKKTLYIYGPKGTKKYMKELMRTFVYAGDNRYPIKVQEVSNSKFLETKDFYLESKPMTHKTPCNAYCFVKKGKLRIDKKKLKKFKIPSGPLLGKLKQGKDIKYKGKIYKASQLTYKQNETKISFVFDTTLNPRIVPFVKNSTILISEATFLEELKATAKSYGHLTAKQAAEIAKKSNSKKLILTHISQRYEKNLDAILKEAKKTFKNSSLAKDLDVVEVVR
jgi:ribonuclease Z